MKTKKKLKLNFIILFCYILISTLFFGLGVIFRLNTSFVGNGSDPTQFMWAFSWFPFALTHHLNLLFTHYAWSPEGKNLAWSTIAPFLSFLFFPSTYFLGPVVSYNIAILLAPALAAFSTYLLIEYITNSKISGFISGYIFGFSSFEIGQTLGHIEITFVCLLPLMILLFLLNVDKKINRITFIILLSLSLSIQFLIGQEVFTMFNLFGILSIIISLFIYKEQRKDLLNAFRDVIFSYILTIIIISPYLYAMISTIPKGTIHNPDYWVTDLLNFFIPTPLTLIGGKTFISIASKFNGNYAEEDGYLGLPLIFLLILYIINFYKTKKGKFLILIFIMISIFSLGPTLHIYGNNTNIIMPWYFFARMPLLKDTMPNRFTLYVFLITAIIVGYFVKEFQIKKWQKSLLIGLIVLFILPSFPYPATNLNIPSFFSKGLYKKYLKKKENVLFIPFERRGYGSAYQAICHMYFRMTAAYVGKPQKNALKWSAVQMLLFYTNNSFMPNYSFQILAFIGSHDVKAVILQPGIASKIWYPVFNKMRWKKIQTGGITLYYVPNTILNKYKHITLSQVNRKFSLLLFNSLYNSSIKFLNNNKQLSNLLPYYLESHGYLPKSFGYKMGRAINWTNNGGWIGPWTCRSRKGICFGLGISGNINNLKYIIAKYRLEAKQIFFPYPKVYNFNNKRLGSGQLLMVFRYKKVNK